MPTTQAQLDDTETRLEVADGQRTLYAALPTAKLRLSKGQVLALGRDGQQRLAVPVSAVARIVVVGPVGVSAGLRTHAMTSPLDVVFLSRRGSFQGRYDAYGEVAPDLRRAQYGLEADPRRLELARTIVDAKLASQRTLLRRYRGESAPEHEFARSLGMAMDRIGEARLSAADCGDVEALLGYEGAAAAAYFGAWTSLLPSELGFRGRRRRPPTDIVNAALGFGYALLLGECVGALAQVGLDPWVGVLHRSGRRVPSLGLDLMEFFRVPVVDSSILSAVRRGRLTIEEQRRDGGATLLNATGRQRVVRAFETRMRERSAQPSSGQRLTYRQLVLRQARAVAAAVKHGDPMPSRVWR